MIAYRPVNLAQTTPTVHAIAAAKPGVLANLAIVGMGVLVGAVSYRYRNKPLGMVGVGAGGSIAGAGLIFILLDVLGKPPSV